MHAPHIVLAGGGALLLSACLPVLTHADGSLPPLPYRYLHPPLALKSGNRPPANGMRLLPADYMRAVTNFVVFTQDGQAGISGERGAIRFARSASAVVFRIDPVDTPAGLPSGIAPDGNAYRFRIVQQPDGRPVAIASTVSLTFEFPHVPTGIYRYAAGRWSSLCRTSTAFISTSTITCPSKSVGIFTVVTNRSNSLTPMPTTPISSTPFAWINRYIPLIAALVVILGAAIVGYAVSAPGKRKTR